jgi:hypothetical protein
MNSNNRTTIKTRNTGVSAGIDKHIPSPILIGGVTYTPPELKAVFVAQTAALAASDAAHNQWLDEVQAERDASKEANAVYSLLRSFLIGQYGTGANAILNDFGMTTPKAGGPKTVQVKAEAVVKGKATRAARHTMGSVQRKAVTGTTVAATTTTPTTPPTATAPAPVTPAPTMAQTKIVP